MVGKIYKLAASWHDSLERFEEKEGIDALGREIEVLSDESVAPKDKKETLAKLNKLFWKVSGQFKGAAVSEKAFSKEASKFEAEVGHLEDSDDLDSISSQKIIIKDALKIAKFFLRAEDAMAPNSDRVTPGIINELEYAEGVLKKKERMLALTTPYMEARARLLEGGDNESDIKTVAIMRYLNSQVESPRLNRLANTPIPLFSVERKVVLEQLREEQKYNPTDLPRLSASFNNALTPSSHRKDVSIAFYRDCIDRPSLPNLLLIPGENYIRGEADVDQYLEGIHGFVRESHLPNNGEWEKALQTCLSQMFTNQDAYTIVERFAIRSADLEGDQRTKLRRTHENVTVTMQQSEGKDGFDVNIRNVLPFVEGGGGILVDTPLTIEKSPDGSFTISQESEATIRMYDK